MKRTKKMWMPIALGMLLMAVLVGVAGGMPNELPQASAGIMVTIPPAAFNPVAPGCDYLNAGHYVTVNGGTCTFHAPLFFPPGRPLRVNRIIIYAEDNNENKDLCVKLFRMNPATTPVANEEMATVCTTGKDSAVRTFTTTAISPDGIAWDHGPYLWLEIPGRIGLSLYGVKLDYTRSEQFLPLVAAG